MGAAQGVVVRGEDKAMGQALLGLVFPAYDHTLRCSHLFNTLDARGALATAERETYIARVRALARACAETYVAEVVGAQALGRSRG